MKSNKPWYASTGLCLLAFAFAQLMVLDSKNFYAKALKYFFLPNIAIAMRKDPLANYATNDEERAIASMVDND